MFNNFCFYVSDYVFFKPDMSKRVRFLQELEDGYEFHFHSDFNSKVYELCLDPEDHEDCPLCKQEIPYKEEFCWTVWDYDANETRILKTRMTSASFGPSLIEMFEEFGTIMDRDYKIKKIGKGTGSSYVVTPLDRSQFRGKAHVYTKKEMEDIFKKAYSSEVEVQEAPKKAKKEKKPLIDSFKELDWDTVKGIALDFGMTKKEVKAFDEEVDDLVDELFETYEEADLAEAYEELEDNED